MLQQIHLDRLMTITQVLSAAADVKRRYAEVEIAERYLNECVASYLKAHGWTIRGAGRELGISASYLCDIVNGRRKISEEMMERLMKLEGRQV